MTTIPITLSKSTLLKGSGYKCHDCRACSFVAPLRVSLSARICMHMLLMLQNRIIMVSLARNNNFVHVRMDLNRLNRKWNPGPESRETEKKSFHDRILVTKAICSYCCQWTDCDWIGL